MTKLLTILLLSLPICAKGQINLLLRHKAVESSPAIVKADTLTIAIFGQSNAGQRNNVSSVTSFYTYLRKNYTNARHAIRNGATYPFVAADVNFSAYNKTYGYYGADLGIIDTLSKYCNVLNIVQFYVGANSLHTNFNSATAEVSKNQYYYGVWNSADTSYLQQMVSKYHLKINVFVWIQGEQDAIEGSTTYQSELTALIGSVRTHYGSDVLFVYNQLITPYDGAAYETGKNNVRTAQANVQSANNLMINMDDIGTGDTYQVHYDVIPTCILGLRFGIKIKNHYSFN